MLSLTWKKFCIISFCSFVLFPRSSSTKLHVTLNIVCSLPTSKISAIVASVPCEDGIVSEWELPPLLIPLLFPTQELCQYMPEQSGSWKHIDCRVTNEVFRLIAKHKMFKEVYILYDDTLSPGCLQDVLERLSFESVSSQLIHVAIDESARNIVQHISNTSVRNIFYAITKEHTIKSILHEMTSVEKLRFNNYWIITTSRSPLHAFVDSSKVDLYEKYILFLTMSSNSKFNGEKFERLKPSWAKQEYKEGIEIEYRTNFTIEVKDELNCNVDSSTTDIYLQTVLKNLMKHIELSPPTAVDVYSTNRINRSLEKVAVYRENLKIYDQRLSKNIFKDFGNLSLSVVFVSANPYIEKSIDVESEKVVYSGFCHDILDDLAKALNFRYQFKDSVDGLYGNPTDDFSNATGMIGMVMRGEVDIAIGPITVTADRLRVVDFLTPFQEEGIGFLMKKIDTPPLEQMFQVFRPFSMVCWVAVAVSIVVTGIILSIIARLSPAAEDKDVSLSQNLWMALSSILGQEDGPRPKFLQGHIILGFWWIFITLVMALYASSLAAFLTVTLSNVPLKNLEELASQTHYKPLVNEGTNHFHMFKTAKGGLHRRIWEMMSDMPRITTIDEAFTLVRTGKYAFLSDSSELQFELQNKCDEMEIAQESYLLTHLSFVVRKKFPFKEAFDNQ